MNIKKVFRLRESWHSPEDNEENHKILSIAGNPTKI
jgi:hypothetical protein